MKLWLRIALGIAAAAGLLISVFMLCLPHIAGGLGFADRYIRGFTDYLWTDAVDAGFYILGALVFLWVLLLCVLRPARHIVYRKQRGKIEISEAAVISAARHAIAAVPGAGGVTVTARLSGKPGGTRIFVHAEAERTSALPSLGAQLQSSIETALAQTLEVPVKSVSVRISGLNAGPVPSIPLVKPVQQAPVPAPVPAAPADNK